MIILVVPNIHVADCGHKIGLNSVDNGRIWIDNVRIPRENLLNSVANVSPDGQYLSAIKDPNQRFAAFLATLTTGCVISVVSAIYSSKIGLAIAIRYSLTRRAFSIFPNGPEVLLLDYPRHQQRLLPLLAKTCAMSFAANYLKRIYVKRTSEANKTIHVLSSAFKATFTWHNMRTLQECREACGGQGLKTENRVGHLKSEYDVHSTFEGDNNVLMQQSEKTSVMGNMSAKLVVIKVSQGGADKESKKVASVLEVVYRWTSSLHFIDTPDKACTFDYSSDCHDSNGLEDMCVAGPIQNFTSQLMHYKEGSSDRRYNMTEALLFLSHFMGDIHQPLHVGSSSDEGANTINLCCYRHKSNLHHVSTEFPILTKAKLGAGLLILKPSGFALLHYADSSKIGYVIQGSGKAGVILRSEEEVVKLHKGDMTPIPLGSTSWWFNDEKDTDFGVVFLGETSKANNPGNITYFFLAGALGVFNGFSTEFQKRAIGLSEEETTKVAKSQTGALIVKVDDHDNMPEPSTIGTTKQMIYNTEVAEPNVSVKHGGMLVVVTSEEVGVLKDVGLSGAVVKLHKKAMYAPNFSSDSAFQVNYVAKGSGRVKIVGLNGQNVVDEIVKAGELFVVPSYFVVSVIADGEGMEWFSVVTMEKPVFGQLVGETSVLKAMSPRVLQVALNITPELEKKFRSKMNAAEIFFPESN